MRAYGWSERHVRTGLPGARGWVYYNWALENELTAFGPLVERKGRGYVRQETDRLVETLRHG